MTSISQPANYAVLSPWAEVDPVTLRGLSAPRPTSLEGKTIGLFYMWKRASKPILQALEKHLKTRFPTLSFSWYAESVVNTPEVESPNKARYEDWLKGVDAVIFTYGD
ncbi:MAG TPA: hypothetical protein VLH15_07150 [Dehalococcoidales bacterium]|nr:hypothetical protein [Dehalococcoidales bacterium]